MFTLVVLQVLKPKRRSTESSLLSTACLLSVFCEGLSSFPLLSLFTRRLLGQIMIYDQLNETEWSKSTDGVVFVGNLQG